LKVHELLVAEVATAIRSIFNQGIHADKVIEKSLKIHRKWGARDRRFFAESVYEIVRWWRYLWWLKGQTEFSFEENDLKCLWAIWWYWQKDEVLTDYLKINPNNSLCRGAPAPLNYENPSANFHNIIKERLKKIPPRPIYQSIPDWLDKLGEQELAERWPDILKSLNEKAPVFLRANTLKSDAVSLQKILRNELVESEVIGVETVRLHERKNVFITKAFKDGLFEIQDFSSQQVGYFLRVEPGMRVVDACAGAGGKSLHLAALMKNKGRIIALDVHEWKLNELRTRARRAHIDIIETRVIDGKKTIKRLEESADRLLLDVPCSGSGVLRRNPDAKWKLQLNELENLRNLQMEILGSYGKMLKVGGLMVYSTCSVFPSENELQIEKFLKSSLGQSWDLLEQKRFDPDSANGGDGFFMAVLKKK
jgi:16S rRNA (cytosine967-C5)-methyltransferase